MDITTTFHAPDRVAWRAWLEAHHASDTEIWLVVYKKHTDKPSVTYDEAVEEALCFGWIDGIVKRLDDERYAQRYSPRRPGSNWSELNKWRVGQMLAAGLMTPAGLAAIAFPLDEIPPERPTRRYDEGAIPDHVEAALRADPVAWGAFARLTPSQRRAYVDWITGAKREETQARRIERAIALLRDNKPLGIAQGTRKERGTSST